MTAHLVASGFGDRDTGGGAFYVTRDGSERLDWLASTGMAVDPSGQRLVRLVRAPPTDDVGSELLVYDARGVLTYARIDELSDPHDVVWAGDRIVAAATSANRLLWLDGAGRVVDRWIAPGDGDAWHLNCLLVDQGRLLACAFGRFAAHRAWNDADASSRSGFVFDVASGRTILNGLRRPHHPRRLGQRWLVCDSGRQALAVFGRRGERLGQVGIGGFPRGMVISADMIYVGVNPSRHDAHGGTAGVVALARRDFREMWRTSLPCREVYDLVLVDDAMLGGLRRGFRTNAARVADEDQLGLFRSIGIAPVRLWPTGDPLPPDACRTMLTLDVPDMLTAGQSTRVRWTVRNIGGGMISSAGAHPVYLSWRWRDPRDDHIVAEGERVKFTESLPPGGQASGTAYLQPPLGFARVELCLSLVQELVHWFDELDPANGVRVTIRCIHPQIVPAT